MSRRAQRYWLLRVRSGRSAGVLAPRPMVLVLQSILYMAAVAGIVAGTLGAIFFAGGALNRARPPDMRRRRGVLAALCLCGIVASAALGFVAIPAILYLAQQ